MFENLFSKKSRAGFTLVEMMIVVALIGILAAITLTNFSGARDESREAKTKEELKNISLALLQYRNQIGSLPPGTELCTLCEFRSTASSGSGAAWATQVVTAVATQTSARLPSRDPWGTYYVYENNFTVGNSALPSIVCSLGINKTLDTWTTDALANTQREAQGDDICIFMNEPDDS